MASSANRFIRLWHAPCCVAIATQPNDCGSFVLLAAADAIIRGGIDVRGANSEFIAQLRRESEPCAEWQHS